MRMKSKYDFRHTTISTLYEEAGLVEAFCSEEMATNISYDNHMYASTSASAIVTTSTISGVLPLSILVRTFEGGRFSAIHV